MGQIEFGGAIVSTAFCKGFSEEDRAKLTAVAAEASRAALQIESSKPVVPGVPFRAYELLGQTSRMCEEDLQNITVVVNRIGGSEEEMDLEKWSKKINQNNWAVIRRSFAPEPIWKLLPKYQTEFKDQSKLASIMMEEWRSKKIAKASTKKKINKLSLESPMSTIDHKWEFLTEEENSENSHITQEVDLKAEKAKGEKEGWNEEMEHEMTHRLKLDVDESPQGPKDDVELSGYFQIATEILQNDDGKTQTEKESVARDQKAEKMDEYGRSKSKDTDLNDFDEENRNNKKRQSTLADEQVEAERTSAFVDADQVEGLGEQASRKTEGRKFASEELRLELRKDLGLWIEKFTLISRQNTELCLEELITLKKRYKDIDELWKEEVIYLREVQRRIMSMSKVLKDSTEKKQREDIVTSLKIILDWTQIQTPIQIQTIHFPKIRFVAEIIREAENYS